MENLLSKHRSAKYLCNIKCCRDISYNSILEPWLGLANCPGCVLAFCLVTAGIGSSNSVTLIRNKLYLTEDGVCVCVCIVFCVTF